MMASGGNYSFFSHNLGASAMNQAFDRPKLLKHRHSAENRLEMLGSSSPGERDQPVKQITVQETGEHSVQFIPHPPSSPRSNTVDNPRIAALNSKGKKRSRYESPRSSPSGSEDEKRRQKLAHNAKLEPLPLHVQRRGSNSSLDSLGSTESLNSRANRNLKGIEPLKDIGTDEELVGSFKSHQSKAKSEVLNRKGLKHNVVHPLRVTNEPAELDGDGLPQSQSTPIKSNSVQPPVLNNAASTDDEVTLSSSNDSLTSVSGSEENVSSDSDQESRLEKQALMRNPNSTLPTIPNHVTYRTIQANSSGLYESIVTSGNNERNSASDLKNLSKALAKVATEDGMYVSDTELSVRSTGQVSNVSSLSVLPRLPARTARSRSGNFLKEEMKRYFPDRKIGVFVATWNMHEEKEVPFYLDDFLIPDATDFLQDLYVIGLQESTSLRLTLVKITGQAYFCLEKYQFWPDKHSIHYVLTLKEWEIRLQETLGPSHVLMHSSSFGLLHLSVFIRKELVWFCSALKEDSVATRLGHMIKTKGALAISFSIFGTSFLFINSHFTSDEGKAMDRVNDYKTICRSLSLSPENQANLNNDSDVTANFDRVFWLGDFNFRVGLERSKVDELLVKYKDQENPECLDLLEKDELLGLMQQDKVFVGFSEPPIRFLPSYKHDIQSDEYDSSPKSRVPSWTDRVVYRCKEASSIIPLVYNSCVSVKISDHRPVFGIYEVTLNPCRENVPLTGGQYIRDVYIEANRRRASGARSQGQSSVCIIL